jgi:hypothetical protein
MDPRTRKDRLAQGNIIDVSTYARPVGFVIPVALSRSVWLALVDGGEGWSFMESSSRAKDRRILEILIEAVRAVRGAEDSETARFSLFRFSSKQERKVSGKIAIKNDLLVRCEPADDESPAITIYLEN